jgi:ABC-type polar amino acid transport system ATPase subunit
MTSRNPGPIVALSRVNKWYGALHALRDVDLAVDEGEKIVLCGPSGSGKSTTVFTINGLEPYQGGEVRVGGVRVSERDGTAHELRRHIGTVFQNFNLFPHLSVLENCCLGPMKVLGLSRSEAEARAMEELRRVRIADQARKYPDTLSGGQQQRAAISRALCMRPRVMLFDEPTSALDPEMVGEVLDVMSELSERGMTMIIVTHEMGFTRRVADRVVMMEHGAVVAVLPPERFFDRDAAPPRVSAFLNQILRA